jgi:hypothetical protein
MCEHILFTNIPADMGDAEMGCRLLLWTAALKSRPLPSLDPTSVCALARATLRGQTVPVIEQRQKEPMQEPAGKTEFYR